MKVYYFNISPAPTRSRLKSEIKTVGPSIPPSGAPPPAGGVVGVGVAPGAVVGVGVGVAPGGVVGVGVGVGVGVVPPTAQLASKLVLVFPS